jgi:hypothetical protein
MLLPLARMWDRVDLARDDADTTFFIHLLYAGEMLTKLITAGFVAAVADDRERHQYRLAHKLIRADGLGEWVQALDEALVGPPAQHLLESASEDRRAFIERCASGTWQHEAVATLLTVLRSVALDTDPPSARIPLRLWFPAFANFRNKTRGHGAPTPEICAKLSPSLEQSIRLILENVPLLKRPWAYLHRNLSGRYRVIPLGGDMSDFEKLKTSAATLDRHYRAFADGVYVQFNEFVKVDLIDTSLDVADFFFPNGAFNGKSFELISFISDNRKLGDASPYLAPAGERPPSETQGKGTLDTIGETWTNLPSASGDYVQRVELERELHQSLSDDRHPVITLTGRGGIGKTSLAIPVLRKSLTKAYSRSLFGSAPGILTYSPKVQKSSAPVC